MRLLESSKYDASYCEKMVFNLNLLNHRIHYFMNKRKTDVLVVLPAEIDDLYSDDEIVALREYVKSCVLKKQ